MDPMTMTLLGMFASAIAALFAAYAVSQDRRIKRLETDLATCEETNKALERENKEFSAIFVLLHSEDRVELQKARERVAAILRQQKDYTS